MSISNMKSELHDRLWGAQQRWFALREQGISKHDLKMQGLEERGNMFYAMRGLIFTGATRVEYERELKRFVDFVHQERGKTQNSQIDKRDMKAYMNRLLERGGAASHLNKVRAALVKFGAVYGKYESFHAMSKKMGKAIRESRNEGKLRGPHRPRVTIPVRERTIERLKQLDDKAELRTGQPRGYHLALRLQKEASLRAIEASERLTRASLKGIHGERGRIEVLGKGGRMRILGISKDLYQRLESFFRMSSAAFLAPLRAYQAALRRAILAEGGRSTGSHAQRRTSAQELKNQLYKALVVTVRRTQVG